MPLPPPPLTEEWWELLPPITVFSVDVGDEDNGFVYILTGAVPLPCLGEEVDEGGMGISRVVVVVVVDDLIGVGSS